MPETDSDTSSFSANRAKNVLVLRPGFEPGSPARKAGILGPFLFDRSILPERLPLETSSELRHFFILSFALRLIAVAHLVFY